jgi:hypothetical protein
MVMISYTQAALNIAGASRPIWIERKNGETGKGEKEGRAFLFSSSHLPFYRIRHFSLLVVEG